jgi:hypothetical protein
MDRTIAYCGLICSECPSYLHTQAGDMAALAKLADKARAEHGVPDATAESVMCDGCIAAEGRKIGYCATCAIRACAVERHMPHCAACDDYGCDKIEEFLGMVPVAREVLDGLRPSM